MKNTIFIGTLKGHEKYHYKFIYPECNKSMTLATGIGRYGQLGSFSCIYCNSDYYATIYDHQNPNLYVYYPEEVPNSYLEGNSNGKIILTERNKKI
ncbi:MAG: hypothetical protein IJZ64_00630 [Ruminococcus sp.]|nr:hypothetical protein [Ruminococcus sp.]